MNKSENLLKSQIFLENTNKNKDKVTKTEEVSFITDKYWFRQRAGALIVENNHALFMTSDNLNFVYTVGGGVKIAETAADCVRREIMEELGVEYEIYRLAVVYENFFTGMAKDIKGLSCHQIEFYFLMKSRGNQNLNSHSLNFYGFPEQVLWIPLDKLQNANIKPEFLKTRFNEILESKNIVHIVKNYKV